MSGKRRPLYGVGINDAPYRVTKYEYINGFDSRGKGKRRIVWRCPFYTKWKSMLTRCHSTIFKSKNPTYIECSVCDEWLIFSNFRKWMIAQEWENNHLDKDLLVEGNKIYSPKTCIFVSGKVNQFMSEHGNARGDYLLGCDVSRDNKNKFRARCADPFNRSGSVYLGYFDTEVEAHLAWKKHKHDYACELANSEYVTEKRVRQVLLNRYKNYTVVEDHIK